MTQISKTSQDIARDLRALGVRPGGYLLVHTSLRSLGLPGDGPDRAEVVIQGLLEALGPDGTLLMPALSYETVNAQNPVFDVRTTPTCVGALPEYFRTRTGTLRSVHPTHSVCAVGKHAEDVLKNHERDSTPVGENSPFAKMPKVGGQLLFIGCGLRPDTTMHGVEEHVVPPYLFGDPVDYRITLADGTETSMTVRSHNFKGWEQHYDRIGDLMQHGCHKGQVLQAESFLLEAAEMWFTALSKLRDNPLYFVDKEATPGEAALVF